MGLSDVLGKLAPTVATLLSGPFAGMAIEALGSALGVSEPTKRKIEDAITAGNLTGDQLAAVKLAEQQMVIRLEELGVRRDELAYADAAGARAMQMTTQSKMPAILTTIITVGFFGTLGTMFYMPEVKDSAPLMIMLGQLSAGWAAAIAFYFGTTSGSKAKTDLLAQSAPVKG